MSTSADTAFERIPQTDRDAVRGRSNPEPNTVPKNSDASPQGPDRFALSGTSGPLARFSPDPSTYLTDAFQGSQTAISSYVSSSIRALWDQHMNPDQFSSSWRDLGAIVRVLVAQHFEGSAVDAAEFYRNMKVVNGLDFPKVIPARLDTRHLINMAGAVANGTFYHQLNTKGEEAVAASGVARNTLSGAAARFTLNGARNTITAAVANDPEAEGWDRLTEPGACSYCVSQAAKGPFKPGNTGFRAHDYCHCLAVPIFKGIPPHGPTSQLRDEWNRITGTFTGKEARATWEQYQKDHATSDESARGENDGY